MGEPVVSVTCATFNQREYIADAIEGFINQDTTFPYEVIIHDDASTDGTAEIVAGYAEEYPGLIVPILQAENQYSKGKGVLRSFLLPMAKGEYVAMCEGDDYWISRSKLQRQFDILNGNPDTSLCLHNGVVLDYVHDSVYLSEPNLGDREKTLEQLILEGGGLVNPTGSFFFRKELLGACVEGAPVGDHFHLMDLASRGKVMWLSEPMSVYRFGAKGSWTTRDYRKTAEAKRVYHESYINALRTMDERTGRKCSPAFEGRIQLQLDCLKDETLPLGYAARRVSTRELLRRSNSARVFMKALAKRYLADSAYAALKKAELRSRKRKEGTLLEGTPAEPPRIAFPLA